MNEFQLEHERDCKKCEMYLVNAIIVDYSEYHGKYPTVDDVKSNWRFSEITRVNDEEIEKIIRDVEKCDMGIWN